MKGILQRIVEDRFVGTISTIGVDFRTRSTKHCKFDFTDCAGQERFRSITVAYTRNIQMLILGFDVTDLYSFEAIPIYDKDHSAQAHADVIKILVGHKIDLTDRRVVTKEQALKMAEQLDVDAYFETSAKTGEGVEELFYAMEKLAQAAICSGLFNNDLPVFRP